MGAQPEAENAAGGLFPLLFPTRPTTTAPTNVNKGNSSSSISTLAEGGSIALSIVIVIGICFLVLNVCACAGVFYQRDRVRFKEILLQRQYKLRSANDDVDGSERGHEMMQRTGRHGQAENGDESGDEILGPLSNQASTISTMDPHTKVSQWIAQGIDNERNNSQTIGGSGSSSKVTARTGADAASMRPLLNQTDSSTANIYGLVIRRQLDERKSMDQRERTSSAAIIEAVPAMLESSLASGSASKTSTARRKSRAKSQLSLQRSMNKRDVAVGNDDDDYATSVDVDVVNQQQEKDDSEPVTRDDTIDNSNSIFRKLNLPKVLPDLAPPCQDGPIVVGRTRASLVNTSSPSIDLAALPESIHEADAVVYSNPMTDTKKKIIKSPMAKQSTKDGSKRTHKSQSSAAQVQTADHRQQRSSIQPLYSTPTHGSGSSTILKTNFPNTLVVARHPRRGPDHNSTAMATNTVETEIEPEPCLVVRPGKQKSQQQSTMAPSDDTDTDGGGGGQVILRQSQPRSSTAARNTRSWYAQYSQSLMSQSSIDQENELKEGQDV